MRRSRRSAREEALDELFDTSGLEAEPLDDEPDAGLPLRPFSQEAVQLEPVAAADEDVVETGDETEPGEKILDPVRLLRRARRARRADRYHDALQAYQELVRLEPGHREGRLELSRLLEAHDDAAGALIQLDALVGHVGDDPEILVERGALHGRMGEFAAADADLNRALRLAPEHTAGHFQMGLVLSRRGRYEEAIEQLRRATELSQELAAAHLYLGDALNKLGRLGPATESLERARDLEPEDPRAYHLLGRVLDRTNRPDEAAEMYQKARELSRP